MFNILHFDKVKLIIFPWVLLSVIAFEITLYPYYVFTSMTSFILMFLMVLYFYKIYIIKDAYWFLVLLYCFVCCFISFYYFNSVSLVRSIFTFFSFYLCYLLVVNRIDFLKIYFYISLVPLALSFVMQVKGDFFIWSYVYGRNASFIFDPNYCGALFVSSALISLILFKNLKVKWFYFIVFLFGVLFTFSKGAVLALLVGFLFYLYTSYYVKSVFYVLISFVFVYIFYIYSNFNFSLFRVEQGYNSRDKFFDAVLQHVFRDGNYMGGDSDVLRKLMESNDFVNKSTHNFYMDLLINNGLIPLLILMFLIFVVGYVGFKDRNVYLSLFLALFVVSNSVSISLGGIGILSLIFTFSAVMILQRKKDLLW